MTAGQKIKHIRNLLNITQEKLASLAGISRSYLANVESGKLSTFPYELIFALWDNFGINPKWILKNEFPVFVDSQKGVELISGKKFLTVDEIYFLLNLMQYVYSHIDSISFEVKFPVKKDFYLTLLNLAKNFGLKNSKSYNLERDAGTIKLCDEFVAYLINYILEKDFSLSQGEIDLLNQNLLPWSYYVAKAAVEYEKRQLKPVLSAFIDTNVKELDKYLSFEIEKFSFTNSHALLSFNHDFITLNLKPKMLIEIEKEKFFALIALFEHAKVDQTVEILDFKMFYDRKTSHLKQRNLSVALTSDEFEQIKSLFSKVKEKKILYDYFQARCIDKYGFV